MTATQVIYKYLDTLPECELSGWQLFDIVREATGRSHYPTTIIQICREYADITGADFTCIDHNKSRYRFKPCARLGAAIIDYKINID